MCMSPRLGVLKEYYLYAMTLIALLFWLAVTSQVILEDELLILLCPIILRLSWRRAGLRIVFVCEDVLVCLSRVCMWS
jgi:hypothetical protein